MTGEPEPLDNAPGYYWDEDDENYLDDEAEDAARRGRERDEARSAYYDSLW